jgi:hypothetical protein
MMDDAEAAGRAVEVGSNFFLFFSSQQASMGASAHAAHMHHSEPAKPSTLPDASVIAVRK